MEIHRRPRNDRLGHFRPLRIVFPQPVKDHRGLEGSQFKQILETKKPFYEPDTRKSPHPRIQSLVRAGLLTAFCAPSLSEGECVGFLNVGSEKPDALTKEQMDLLVSVADHLALDLRNAELYARAKESGERLDNFVRGALDGIVTTDLEGRITSWNPGAEAIYGYTEREAVGAHVSEIFDQDEEITQEIHERMKSGGNLPHEERTFHRKDGSQLEVSVTYSAVRENTGQVVGISGIGRDITERNRAEEALKLTQFSVERSADAVLWIHADGGFAYVNEAACRLLGYAQEELLSMAVWDIDPKLRAAEWPGQWADNKRRGIFTFETLQISKDGKSIPVEISVNYLEFGGKEYCVSYVRDITERKEAEEALRLTQFSVDRAGDAAFWIAADGRFLYVNDAVGKYLGYSREELLSMTIFEINPDYTRRKDGQSVGRTWWNQAL